MGDLWNPINTGLISKPILTNPHIPIRRTSAYQRIMEPLASSASHRTEVSRIYPSASTPFLHRLFRPGWEHNPIGLSPASHRLGTTAHRPKIDSLFKSVIWVERM